MEESEKVFLKDKSFQLQVNFGQIINGMTMWRPIPENFISLSSMTWEINAG